MRNLGYAMVAIGVVWLLIAFNMETSVPTSGGGYYGLPDRVENIGLIAQRQNHLIVASLITLIGVLLAIFGGQIKLAPANTAAAPAIVSDEPAIDRDLTSDAYRLWLAERYQVQRNELFDKFVFDSKTYATLDDALAAAHAVELDRAAAAEVKLTETEARYQENLARFTEEQKVVDAKVDKLMYGFMALIIVGVVVMLIINFSH